jgi:hypothetical protein
MDQQFKEDCKTVPRSQVSLQRKSFSRTYLIYHLFARGRATSKHGGGGRYDVILEFKGEQVKKIQKKGRKKIYIYMRKIEKI